MTVSSGSTTRSSAPPPPSHRSSAPPPSQKGHHSTGSLKTLTLGALGVVYGDIGTSPLYTLKECLSAEEGVQALTGNVLGVLSLVFWALMMVVTFKYLMFIMRADNKGEGGILALLALVPERMRMKKNGTIGIVAILVIVGAALLYGDGMITPVISVLGAVEGLPLKDMDEKERKWLIVAVTCVILLGLFVIQSRGTKAVGRLFGPIMVVWFFTIGTLGAYHLAHNLKVMHAVNPVHAVRFFQNHGWHGFRVLGSVVLAITGGEALYADMGHFGRRPIRIAWMCLVLPALVLAYFGQGAIVLADPAAAENPFYAMVPQGIATFAMVGLATMAAIIASQALISGAFSLTHSAVQLGFFPRVTVRHTSKDTEGQIYVPEINWMLAVSCIVLTLNFQESSRLAAAYGIAVTGTMGITSIVFFVVSRVTWKWPLYKALPLLLIFLALDIPFFAANAMKFFKGGYVPVAVALVFLTIMVVWKRGRFLLGQYVKDRSPPLQGFLAKVPELGSEEAMKGENELEIVRVRGTGVFMASNPEGVPPVLVHHVERAGVLHDHIVLLTIMFEHVPYVESQDRLRVSELGKGFVRVVAAFGFMETPDVPRLLEMASRKGKIPFNLTKVTYFLGRETFIAGKNGKMGQWSEMIFSFLSKNSRPATSYFMIPPERVLELGSLIDL